METIFNNVILVPTDFSEVCNNAINQSVIAAKHLGYKLVLLHVINNDTRAFLNKKYLHDEYISDRLKKQSEEIKQEHKIEISQIVKEGSIFKMIAEAASETGARMIFLGTHGKSGMQHITGSFALKVITGSPAPVIVTQEKKISGGFRQIVFAITNGTGIPEKARWAEFMAREFSAKINIFQINTTDPEIIKAAQQVQSYFEESKIGYSYLISVKESGFAEQVIDYATAVNADLIMIMTNPNKNFSKFLLSNVDEDIIFNKSQIPVMCINPKKIVSS
jgi:nucleotide-binding universal stress UspA family protein